MNVNKTNGKKTTPVYQVLGAQTSFDIAQTVARGELRESHAKKLSEARKFANSQMALIPLDVLVGFVLGQIAENLHKDGSAGVHRASFARC